MSAALDWSRRVRTELASQGRELALADGDVLFREGDPGDALYFVLDGGVDILVRDEVLGGDVHVVTLAPEEMFGEQALLEDGARVRTATVRAAGPARLLAIPGDAFRALVRAQPELARAAADVGRRHRQGRLLQSLSILRDLRTTDVPGLDVRRFAAGETVITEGEPGDCAFFVLDGIARVRRGEEVLARLGREQVFGERALLSRQPRAATVEAETRLEVLRIEGASFLRLVESHPPLRGLLGSLEAAYRSSDGGFVTVHRGFHNGEPAVSTVRVRADGRRVVFSRLLEREALAVVIEGEEGEEEQVECQRPGVGERRSLRLAGGRIAGLWVEGEADAGALVQRALDPRPVGRVERARFAWTGELQRVRHPGESLVCACLGIAEKDVQALFADGASAVDVRRRTGAGSACGSCIARIAADAPVKLGTRPAAPASAPEAKYRGPPGPGELLVTRGLFESVFGKLPFEQGDHGLFGPESMTWFLVREVVIILGGGRAGMLQLAHPTVARGVAEHSTVEKDPFMRLRRTLDASFTLTFGTRDEVAAVARRIHEQHAAVAGSHDETSGAFRRGEPYEANDAEALLWVSSTIWDTVVVVFEALVRPLTTVEKDRLVGEAAHYNMLFGIPPERSPGDWAAFRKYFDGMLASSRLSVGDNGRRLTGAMFGAPRPSMVPVFKWLELLATGWLPEHLRGPFGLKFGPVEKALFHASLASMRATLPGLPAHLRFVPAYFHATRRLGGYHGPDLAAAALDQLLHALLGASGPSKADAQPTSA